MKKNYIENYKNLGSSYIPEDEFPMSKKDLMQIEKACDLVKKEYVEIGDANEPNHLWVGRFMSDKDRPRVLNKELAKKVLPVLKESKIKQFVKNITGINKDIFLRRVQFNQIDKDCFIGYHLDVDSNPDYLCACVIQFGRNYEGGIFRVYQKSKKFIDYKTSHYSLMISNCQFPHEVTKVISGSRKSLVFFYSFNNQKNKRYKNEL